MIGRTNAIAQAGTNTLDLLFQQELTEYTIPEGVTKIRDYTFMDSGKNVSGTTLLLPSTLEEVGKYGLGCEGTAIAIANNPPNTILNIPPNLKILREGAFLKCIFPNDCVFPEGLETIEKSTLSRTTAKKIKFPSTVKQYPDQVAIEVHAPIVEFVSGAERFNGRVFTTSNDITTIINIPNTLIYIHPSLRPFHGCSNLEIVTFEQGFNCNNMNLSDSAKFSSETIVNWLEALADRTGQDTYTMTIGTTNLEKLLPEDIAIATSKNWTLA